MKKRFVLVICPLLAGITLPLYSFKEVENISKNDDTICIGGGEITCKLFLPDFRTKLHYQLKNHENHVI